MERIPTVELMTVVDGLIPLALKDPRICILWLEGDSLEQVRRPYERLDLRMAAMDPDFDPLYGDRQTIFERIAPGAMIEEEPVEFEGRRAQVTLPSGTRFRVTFERMSLLGKKGRAEVAPLVDKTGQFRFVLHRDGHRS